MKVLIDGKPLAVSRTDAATAMAEGIRLAEAAGRIVVEVLADGKPLNAVSVEAASSLTCAILELKTTDTKSLVAATLRDAADALSHASRQQVEAATAIQRGEPELAVEPIKSAIGTWQMVRDAYAKCSTLSRVDLNVLEPKVSDDRSATGAMGTKATHTLEDDLATSLGTLRDAFTRQDWAALSDVLKYDLPEQCDRWRAALTRSADAIRNSDIDGGADTGVGRGVENTEP